MVRAGDHHHHHLHQNHDQNLIKILIEILIRISANNGEGWGEPGPAWNFATKGAGGKIMTIIFIMALMMMMRRRGMVMLLMTMLIKQKFSFFHKWFSEPSVKAGAGVQSASILLLISCFALLVKSVWDASTLPPPLHWPSSNEEAKLIGGERGKLGKRRRTWKSES